MTRTHDFQDLAKPLSTRMTFQLIAEFHVIMRDKYEQLEARIADQADGIVSGAKYAGTWQRQVTYPFGALVTRSGALWHCNVESNGIEPGDGAAWTLCAKSGSDVPKTIKQMKEAR
ncbi:portal protein [Mesorhizobium sp. LNHC232B00]|nr:portal protein [Mesorhizobium sp. LNHC232B00]